MDQPSRHQCWVYTGAPSEKLSAIAALIVERLSAGLRCLYLHNPTMVTKLQSSLEASGLNVDEEIDAGALLLSSDQSHLVDGRFEVEPMLTMLRNAVHKANVDGYTGLWASGDITWEFGNEKNLEKLLEYECKLEQLFRETPTLQGICQYHMDSLPGKIIQEALHVHQGLFINSTLSRMNPYYVAPEVLSNFYQDTTDSKLRGMLERLGLPPYPDVGLAVL